MSPRDKPLAGARWRGAARLATQATVGLSDLVEAMHHGIASGPGAPGERTRGITGLVYGSIRGISRLVGGGAEGLLGLLGPALGPAEPGPRSEAMLAALNGVLGDRLAADANPLAIEMGWRRHGRPLEAGMPGGPRLLVLIHGLCMNDLQWTRQGHNHGEALARELGYTPVWLRYNSGLPIAANGLALAGLLEQLLRDWPQAPERLVLLGHSMGGLLARSALHQAELAGMDWPRALGDLVCLGSPHFGAPLERAGHGVDLLLDAAPYAAPLARLGKLRSAGITDLRHGLRLPLPQRPGLRCYALAGSLGREADALRGRWLGDGLVPLASALGRHRDPAQRLDFGAARQWVAHGVGHLDLLSRPEVYAKLREWLA